MMMMMTTVVGFVALVVARGALAVDAQSGLVVDGDRAALAALCAAVGADACALGLARGEEPCPHEFGGGSIWGGIKVGCACEGGDVGCRVTTLVMSGMDLRGMLPGEDGRRLERDGFGALEVLDLSSNAIRGGIPEAFIASMPRLRELYLNLNLFTGEIPRSIGSLTELVILNIDGGFTPKQIFVESFVPAAKRSTYGEPGVYFGNQLTGSIPTEIGKLINLRVLNLHRNFLGARGDSYALPRSIGNLKRLETMDVSGNQLYGRIPNELSTLPRLRQLNLDDNFMSGPIPPDWSQALALESFILEGNRLTGTLPDALPKNLTFLDLHENALTGSVNSIRSLKRLEVALLDRNRLSGPATISSADLPNLKTISLANNPGLCGDVPTLPIASDQAKAAECDKPTEPCQLWPVTLGTKLGQACQCVEVGRACSVLSLNDDAGERCCANGSCAEVPYAYGVKYCLPCSEENQKCGGAFFDGARCCARDLTCTWVNDYSSVCRPCSAVWEQCGGSYFSGAKCCAVGNACVFFSEYYSQCQPM